MTEEEKIWTFEEVAEALGWNGPGGIALVKGCRRRGELKSLWHKDVQDFLTYYFMQEAQINKRGR